MTRILLIGQDGQVGQELQKTLASLGEVIGVGRQALDLSQTNSIQSVIQTAAADLVINAAAYTAVDKAESEVELATAINGTAVKQIAITAEELGIPLIHISTDYVFNGQKNTPYLETDPTNPLSVYGQSKLAGETAIQQVQQQHPDFRYAILRTAWVYGVYGKGNFVKTMLRLGKERETLRVVVDQVGTPTWAAEIAKAIAVLANQFLNPTSATDSTDSAELSGIYHFTNSGVTSWYDFAIAIFEEAKSLGIPLQVKQVVAIPSSDYPTPAQRPAYSVLSNQKIQTLLPPIPQWRQSLRQMLTEHLNNL